MSQLRLVLFGTCIAVGHGEVIKGVSYGPVPLKSVAGASEVPADDWFCDEAVPMWGQAGRADLAIMSRLGANMVRLYGNNPETDHANFLDEALANGLSVAPGMSDYPYYQMGSASCMQGTDFDCFTQVKPLYLKNLRNGFLNSTNSYHPALRYMNIVNEPDLKLPASADLGGLDGVYQMCRAVISALDGMLEAEKEAEVTGPLINFTATFSFAICNACEYSHGKPALAQMAQLDDAMRDPHKYGYRPRNNITRAYLTRFTHSFNTANPARDVESQFLNSYEDVFPSTPVYIAEYHRVGANQTQDLQLILQVAESSPLFLGISFFQFQVAYWKTGSEMDFGMFGLGEKKIASMPYFSKTYDIFCLQPVESAASGRTLPEAMVQVYGGSGIDAAMLCAANPSGVQLDQSGYLQIAAQHSAKQMAVFVQRVIRHMGETVRSGRNSDLEDFASVYSGDQSQTAFARMSSYLGGRPEWIELDPKARCVADRDVAPGVIGSAIGWVCSQSGSTCDDIPAQCQSSTYRLGDYVFSRFVQDAAVSSQWNPLVSCSFGGAALFAPSDTYRQWIGADLCVVDGATTTSWTSVTTTTTVAIFAPTTVPATTPEAMSATAAAMNTTTVEARVATPAAPAETSGTEATGQNSTVHHDIGADTSTTQPKQNSKDFMSATHRDSVHRTLPTRFFSGALLVFLTLVTMW